MDDRLGQGLGDHRVEELAVLDRADEGRDLVAGDLAHASIRSASERIGVRESVDCSMCQRRREKLSTIETSWPRAEKRIAVGQPR